MKTRVFIPTVVIAMLVTQLVLAAPFQRMRIPAGVQRVPSAGGRITAICLDGASRPAPSSKDYYSAASDSISVTRVTPNGKQTLSYHEATRKWIDVRGDDSPTSLIVTPKKTERDVEYHFNVTEGGNGVLGEHLDDVSEILGKIQKKTKALDSLDAFTQKLETVLGRESEISELVRIRKFEFESEITRIDAAEVERESEAIVREIRQALAPQTLSPRTRLEALSVIHAKPLLKEQIQSLRELNINVAGEYAPEFKSKLDEFNAHCTRLADAFGSDSQIAREFSEEVRARYQGTRDLTAAIEGARTKSEIIPLELREIGGRPGARDALSLYLGTKITDGRAATLKTVFNWDGGKATGHLDRHVYIAEGLFGDFELRTTTSTTKVAEDDLTTVLRRLSKSHPNIVVDELPSPEVLEALHKQGIHFVRKLDRIMKMPADTTKNVKLVFAMANDRETNKVLFEGQNLEAIAKAAEIAAEIPHEKRVFTKSKAEFDKAIDSIQPDERAVVVYHGTDEIHFSDGDVSIKDYLGRCDPLSCFTFRLDDIGDVVSTGRIDIEVLCRAVKTAIKDSPTTGLSGGGKKPPEDRDGVGGDGGFFSSFIDAYRSETKVAGKKEKLIKMLILGASGATIVIVESLDDDDDKKDGETDKDSDVASKTERGSTNPKPKEKQ